MSAGIDYGAGKTNIDPETGIRFGVLPTNHPSLTEWLWESLEPCYSPSCPECGESLDDGWDDDGRACPSCGHDIEDGEEYPETPDYYALDDQCEESGFVSEDGELWILKSPYYTRARFCSPCAPGAGYLAEPDPDGVRTYCLGPDWYDGKPPYPIWRVGTDERIA